MARLPDEMLERIKREISVQRLVEARGIKLKRVGKNLAAVSRLLEKPLAVVAVGILGQIIVDGSGA